MPAIRPFRWFLDVIVAFALSVLSAPALAVEFKADMIHHITGESKSGPIFVKGALYRMEQKEEGQQIIVIVNQDTGVIRVLIPERKQYIEFPANDPSALMNDPFQSVKYMVSPACGAASKLVGTETVNGYVCDKYVISMQDTDVITEWVSQKLKFPIKIVNHTAQDTFTEFRNIKEGSIVDTLFQLPAGYTKMAEPGEEPVPVPEWAAKVPSAPIVKAPLKRQMSAGQLIRLKVEAGKQIQVKGENTIEGESTLMAVPFLNGKPIKDPSMYTFNMSGLRESTGITCKQTPQEADEVVIGVKKGTVAVEVKELELAAGKPISAGGELRVPVEPQKRIKLRLENLTAGESVCTVFFFQKGQQVSDSKVGPASVRTFTLKSEGVHAEEEYANSVEADEFVIRVAKGTVLARVSQP